LTSENTSQLYYPSEEALVRVLPFLIFLYIFPSTDKLTTYMTKHTRSNTNRSQKIAKIVKQQILVFV